MSASYPLRCVLVLSALLSACRSSREQSAPPSASASASAPSPSATAASATLSPDEERAARAAVAENCLACHSEDLLAQQRLTRKQWTNVVTKMQKWGAPLEEAHVERVVTYLASRHSTAAGPFVPATVDARVVAAALDPLPDGPFASPDVEAGRAAYQKGCATCHGEDGRGAALGVILVDRPILFRAPEFAAVVRKGARRMPAFPDMKDAEMGAMLAYLRSLPRGAAAPAARTAGK